MATVFIKHGDEFDYANPSNATGIKSNDVVAIGDVVGVALTDILPGSTGTIQVAGVANLPKKTAQAWAQGVKVYWDPVNKVFTTSADDGGAPAVAFVWSGWAYNGALSTDAYASVKLKIS